MSRGRLSFNLQDEEAMKKFREYIGVEDARGKSKRMGKDKKRKSGDGDLRDTGKDV